MLFRLDRVGRASGGVAARAVSLFHYNKNVLDKVGQCMPHVARLAVLFKSVLNILIP